MFFNSFCTAYFLLGNGDYMEDLGKDFGVRDSSFCVCLFRRNRCTSLDTHTHTHTNAGTHFAISPLPLLLPNSSSPLFAVQKQSQGPILILFGGLKVFMFESNSLSSCLRVCLQAVKCYLIFSIAMASSFKTTYSRVRSIMTH